MKCLWSETKLAKSFLHYYGIETPYALSCEGWAEHERKYKDRLPYKLVNWLDDVQDIVWIPINKFYDIRWYLKNRFVTKPHYLKTGFKKGHWHEFDERVLYGLFNELVIFVEQEKGMDNIEWDLTLDDSLSVGQKERSEWLLKAYFWWKDERPKRVDPYDLVDFGELPNCLADYQDEEKANTYLQKYAIVNRMEEEYYQEDSKWLHELIDRRRDLWT